MRMPPLIFAFVLGAAAAVAVGSLAGAPPEIAPIPTRPGPLGAPDQPRVLSETATELRVAPSGKASVRMLAQGEEAFVGILRLQAGAAVPAHRDASEEYIYVLEGEGRMTIDGKTYDVRPKTIVYMPKDVEVSFDNGGADLVAVQVFAGPESAAKYASWKPPLQAPGRHLRVPPTKSRR